MANDPSEKELSQLRSLLERDAISRLVFRYANRLDARDFDGVASCFTDDALLSFNSGAVEHRGIDKIREVYRIALGSGPQANGESTTHLTSNLLTELEQDGRARGRVKVVAYLLRGSVVSIRGLPFDDNYTRDEAGWKISSRHHSVDWQSEIPSKKISIPKFGLHPVITSASNGGE